jgi:hypothetical protein
MTPCLNRWREHIIQRRVGRLYGGERARDTLKHPPKLRTTRRRARWLPAGLAVASVLAVAACGASSSTTSAQPGVHSATASAAAARPSTAASATSTAPTTGGAINAADLAPNSNGPIDRCLLGGRPLNIEFYGIDANSMCTKYGPVLAALSLPNLAVHPRRRYPRWPDQRLRAELPAAIRQPLRHGQHLHERRPTGRPWPSRQTSLRQAAHPRMGQRRPVNGKTPGRDETLRFTQVTAQNSAG